MEALRTDGPHAAQDRLARFYDTDGDYAGASFAQLGPIDPMDITPADLLATTLLSVRIRPGAARRMLDGGSTRRHSPAEASRPAQLRSCARLQPGADGDGGTIRGRRAALSADTVRNPNAWVTASKLCARKRPDLFPRPGHGGV